MKRFLLAFAALTLAVSFTFGQKTDKEMKKQLNDKAVKEAQKQAKDFAKEGWKVYPGSLPMDKQIEQSQMKMMATDENDKPKYITADGNGVAETKSAAEAQAIEMGKLQLAGMIESNIASIVNANLANSQASTAEATSVTEVVQSSKNIIAQQLGFIDPSFKIYRELKDKKIEVQVRVFYEAAQSVVIAKKALKKELKDKLKKTDDEVNKLLDGTSK
jgi:hypothetical protein